MTNALLQRIASPAGAALRDHWRHAALVSLVGAAGLAVLIPIGSLTNRERPGGTALALDDIPAPNAEVTWTAWARAPTAIRHEALGDLFTLLVIVGWATLATAAVVILTRALAHTGERAPEFGIRRAVGASRYDILSGLLVEALAVAIVLLVLGVVAGLVVTEQAVNAWPSAVESTRFAPWLEVLAAAAAVIVGWLTALRFARQRHLLHPRDPSVSLRIPAAQLGLAIAILTAGALVLERGRALTAVAVTSAPPGATLLALDTGELAIPERARQYGELLARLDADADVATASLTAPGAVLRLGTVDYIVTDCGNCYSTSVAIPWHSLLAVHHFASPDTFAAQDITILNGRGFTAEDRLGNRRVAVVNRHLATRHFESSGAVGRDLYLRTESWDDLRTGLWGEPYTVVGVVDDHRSPALGGALQPREAVYLSALQHPPARAQLLVEPRTLGTIAHRQRIARAARQVLGPRSAVHAAVSVDHVLTREGRVLAWFGTGFGIAGLTALLIAIVGVFSTTTVWVRSQAYELDLRRALGATRIRTAAFVLIRAAGMALGGVALGALTFAVVLRKPLVASVPNLPLWAPDTLLPLAALLVGTALLAATRAVAHVLSEPPAARLR